MSNIAIKAENVSKAYQLGEIGTGTMSRDLERWWARIRGKEDPFLRIGESNDRTSKGQSNVVWSLKDVNFEIHQGDAVGIIGRNGAGKSTLLKILSRVTSPTTGKISGRGRIASLLEVGTGFHPELTGRENIFLNGAILGMRKHEIKKQFDAIVDFAGIERYIDTPVKRYSSGMYVRLAFAVAAHLDSEILIVDEVLAVGDAEFQKKCLGKMNDVSKGEGRTVLFVSHNMGNLAQLCSRAVLLQNGNVKFVGGINACINKYVELQNRNSKSRYFGTPQHNTYIKSVSIEDRNQSPKSSFRFNESIIIKLEITFEAKIPDLNLSVIFRDYQERALFTNHKPLHEQTGTQVFTLEIPQETLTPGTYNVQLLIHIPNIQLIDATNGFLTFEIEDTGGLHSLYNNSDLGSFIPPTKWL